ncbi:MAG: hypothetical protein J6Q59_05325, partial [Paludibacteraceae bacterium]|nr:hypothetical protein [Paludibacteraceae bacterium]
MTDNCAATLTLKVNGGTANNVTIGTGGKVSYTGSFPVGTTNLTWTAKDEDGNSKEVSQTITVTDGRPSSTALSLDVCDLDKYSKTDAETYISAQFDGYTLTMGAASDNAATVRAYAFTLAHEASASCTYDGTLTVTEGKPESLLKLEMTVCYIKDNSAEQAKAFIEEKVAGAYTVGNVSTSDGGKTYTYSLTSTGSGTQCSYEGVLAVKEYDKPTLPAMSVADFCHGTQGVLTNAPADDEKGKYTWTNNKNSNNEGPDVSSTAAAGDYSYSYVYTDGNGCEQNGSLSYKVHALPALTAELTQGGKNVTTTVCPSDGGALVITAAVSNFSSDLTYGFSHGTADGNKATLDNECSSADKEVTVYAYHQATPALVCTSLVKVNVDYADAPTLTCVEGEPTKYTITSGCNIDVDFTAPTYTSCMANAVKTFVLQTKQKDGSYKDSATAQTWDNISHSLAPGSYKAIFTVNDACLGNKECEREFTVVDGVEPTITCADTTVSTDAGKCFATVVLNAPEVKDNCGVAGLKVKIGEVETVVSVNGTHTATFDKGEHIVLWTVTDVNGKSNTCTQTVTVEDKENPVISGISDIEEVSCDGKSVSKTINLTVTDNCAATLTLKVNGGTANNVTIGTGGKVSYTGSF